jgi:integrase
MAACSALGPTKPTARAHAYALLRTILSTAVDDGLIPANPCRIRGGGQTQRAHEIRLLTAPELVKLVQAMPEALRAGVLLSAWCGLRYGELAELRRRDVEPDGSVLHVRRGVVYIDGQHIVSAPKSAAGVRDIAVPPHLAPAVLDHLDHHTAKGTGSLLFPGEDGNHLAHWKFRHQLYKSARVIGCDDLHVHDLRHLGAVLAAQSGATIKELMQRLGHTSPAMSMRYQHVAAGRDAQIAATMSAMVAK